MNASETKTYLELSEAAGSAHKFYEVTVSGKQVTIRYGRIGDAGQSSVQKLKSDAEAQAFAAKKVAEKTKKGYAPAVKGGRARRAVARSTVTKPSTTKRSAPLLWHFESGRGYAVGLYIDKDLCWIGNQQGKVFALDHTGEVRHSYQLPDDVQSLVGDEVWRYAGCSDGYVYDLTGRVPRRVYEIQQDADLHWLDILDGRLVVSDEVSCVTAFDPEGEQLWKKKSGGHKGWMVRADDAGVYHGHSAGVTCYDWRGGEKWQKKTAGMCQFGWQEADMVYSAGHDGRVYSFSKAGKPGVIYQCDSFIASCAAAPGGKYVFAGDDTTAIYCFDKEGKRLWKLASGCGVAGSMQYFEERLFLATWSSHLGCLDVSEAAIQAASQGSVPAARAIAAPAIKKVEDALAKTKTAGKGVVLECYREGSKLRVRVASPGYKANWRCQFPRDLREEGARYVVSEVRPAREGTFYRTVGEIKRLVT
jgi:predicted DNA-binding WGR domain protein